MTFFLDLKFMRYAQESWYHKMKTRVLEAHEVSTHGHELESRPWHFWFPPDSWHGREKFEWKSWYTYGNDFSFMPMKLRRCKTRIFYWILCLSMAMKLSILAQTHGTTMRYDSGNYIPIKVHKNHEVFHWKEDFMDISWFFFTE